jgi:hypothetical protein
MHWRCLVGKWRALFEANLAPLEERESGEQYEFGLPATKEQLDTVEHTLGIRLPVEVRELLAEFNGIRCSTRVSREIGRRPDISYLDTEYMAVRVPRYFQNCGNSLPPEQDLRKVVFVYQSNGFGDLYGVCVADVAGHRAGEVVKLDHEVGELEKGFPSLTEFVRRGPK